MLNENAFFALLLKIVLGIIACFQLKYYQKRNLSDTNRLCLALKILLLVSHLLTKYLKKNYRTLKLFSAKISEAFHLKGKYNKKCRKKIMCNDHPSSNLQYYRHYKLFDSKCMP